MRLKAQISAFILIAVALLLLVSAGLIIYTNFFDDTTQESVNPTIANTPVQRFVEGCISLQTQQAISRLGAHGGYIYVPQEIQNNPRLGVSSHPSRQAAVPMWFIGRQSLIPTVDEMEAQMSRYVTETIDFCLQDFTFISDFAHIEKFGKPNATVRLLPDKIVVDLIYDLWVDSGSVQRSQEEFTYVSEVSVLEFIEQAQSLAEEIRGRNFLEELTIDLMSIADPTIPMSNIKFTCEQPLWLERDVKQALETILYYNIPRIQVRGAETRGFEAPIREYRQLDRIRPDDFIGGVPYGELPDDTFEYAHMYFDTVFASDFAQEDVQITMKFLPEFGLQMNVRPSDNGIMRGASTQGGGNLLSFFCMHMYHFTYDVSYPVEIAMVKENALEDGSDFIMRFAIPVSIDHNLPDEDNDPTTFLLVDGQPDEALCSDTFDTPVTILARDKITGFDIPNADIDYQCYTFRCPLGNTGDDLSSGRALLRTQLPQGCYGGYLRAEAPNYKPTDIIIQDIQQTYEVEMLPLTKIPYRVVLGSNNPNVLTTPLRDNQYAVISLQHQDSDYSTYATFGQGQDRLLEIIEGPATYNMTLLVYDGDDFAGGYFGQLTVDYFNLQNELVLHAYEFIPRPRGEDLSEAWIFLQEDQAYKQNYQPVWR